MFETQSGYVTVDGIQKGSTLSIDETGLSLQITDSEGNFGPTHFDSFDLLQFRGSRNGFTLIDLHHSKSEARLGIGGVTTYSVRLAVEDVLFEGVEDILSDVWLLYLEDLAKVVHVSGLQQTVAVEEDGQVALSWLFRPAPPVSLRCPGAKLEVHLGQDMKTGGDPINGPSMTFRYSARLVLGEKLGLYEALKLLNRIRLFFSLLMGRVLGIDEVSLRITDGEDRHDAKIYGLIATARNQNPSQRLVGFVDPKELAALLDEWLLQFDSMADAIHLHMDGLEQRRLPLQLRFQIFIQAIEALHRKKAGGSGKPVNIDSVKTVLREQGIPNDIVDCVAGVLAHAHEPGLRKRLKSYYDKFAVELATLRPAISKETFIARVGAVSLTATNLRWARVEPCRRAIRRQGCATRPGQPSGAVCKSGDRRGDVRH